METSIDQNISDNLLTETSRANLKTTASWAMFLAVLGAIGIGFMILAGLFSMFAFSSLGNMPSNMPFNPAFLSLIYLVMAVIYAIPVYNTFKFSRAASKASASAENMTLEECLSHLKSLFKNMGIMAIVIIGIYILVLIGALVAGLSQGF